MAVAGLQLAAAIAIRRTLRQRTTKRSGSHPLASWIESDVRCADGRRNGTTDPADAPQRLRR